MQLSENHFQVLDALERQEITTQRQLAEISGISLGQANYVLKSLLEKGLVKIGNFRKNPSKIRYAYLLTPKGLEAKSRLAAKFILNRLQEYQELRRRVAERICGIEIREQSRVVFVGPDLVGELVDSIIDEQGLGLELVCSCSNGEQLKKLDPQSFEMVLFFDGGRAMQESLDLRRREGKKLVPLW